VCRLYLRSRMCGRMTLTRADWDEVLLELTETLVPAGVTDIRADEGAAASYRPRYNVAPTQAHPILRGVAGPARLGFASGGCWRAARQGSRDQRARRDCAVQVGFQDAFVSRRCVVPADGFFEWKTGPEGVSHCGSTGLTASCCCWLGCSTKSRPPQITRRARVLGFDHGTE